MARILDENFKSEGYAADWTSEQVGSGASLDENFAIASYSAGTSAPATLGKYCMEVKNQTGTASVTFLRKIFTAPITSFFARMEFLWVDALDPVSGVMSLCSISESNGVTLFRLRLTWDAVGETLFYGVTVSSNFVFRVTTITAAIGDWTRFEINYDAPNDQVIVRVNDTALATTTITAGGTSKTPTIFDFGMDSGQNRNHRVYLDNIRINDTAGDSHNSWPGASYSNPLEPMERLNLQMNAKLEL